MDSVDSRSLGPRRPMKTMQEVFLSASIPKKGRGNFDDTADPFLIQCAVRELVTACLGRWRIVWGGHPSITPMVHAICVDMGVRDFRLVELYQSRYFEEQYPEENRFFEPHYTPKVSGDMNASLTLMRTEMLSRPNLRAAFFIGGMEGIYEEFNLFNQFHGNDSIVYALTAPGGASRDLPGKYGALGWESVDFARLFYQALRIDPRERPALG